MMTRALLLLMSWIGVHDRSLELISNQLSGSIPSTIGSLTALTYVGPACFLDLECNRAAVELLALF
jgi:hypothetical protein